MKQLTAFCFLLTFMNKFVLNDVFRVAIGIAIMIN